MNLRKTAFFLAALLAAADGVCAAGFAAKVRAVFFYPLDSAFRDIYGGGGRYSLELSTDAARDVEMWVEAGLFLKKGELSYTKEETNVRIITLGGGLRYRIFVGKWCFWAGPGLNYYLFHESNLIGTVDAGGVGVAGKLGFSRRMGAKILVECQFGYSHGELEPRDFRFNIGGIEAGIGVAYEF